MCRRFVQCPCRKACCLGQGRTLLPRLVRGRRCLCWPVTPHRLVRLAGGRCCTCAWSKRGVWRVRRPLAGRSKRKPSVGGPHLGHGDQEAGGDAGGTSQRGESPVGLRSEGILGAGGACISDDAVYGGEDRILGRSSALGEVRVLRDGRPICRGAGLPGAVRCNATACEPRCSWICCSACKPASLPSGTRGP